MTAITSRYPANLAARSALKWPLVATGLLLLVFLPSIASNIDMPFAVRIAIRIMIIAISAMSLDLILGFGGMVCFGQAAFVGIGAYTLGILCWHAANAEPLTTWPFEIYGTTNPLTCAVVAITIAGIGATIVGLVVIRTTGIYFIMITFAFAQMLYYVAIALQKYGGEDGFEIRGPIAIGPVNLSDRLTLYYVVLASLVLIALGLRRIVSSQFGLVLRGCKQNERRLRAIGIDTFRYKLAAFTISGAVCGYAGFLLAASNSFVSPSDLSWLRSSELIAIVVLGGIGTIVGPIVGAAIYLVLEFVTGAYTTHWQLIFGPFLILVILLMPQGVIGLKAVETKPPC